jgi:DHA3 family macrolide efflux protein-like MFS transporter
MNDEGVQPSWHETRNWVALFSTIWLGQAFSLFGSQLVQFALVWWLTKSTGSATVLATATLAALLPQIFVGPFAGALVDRWNRRVVMIVADTGVALVTAWAVYLFAAGATQLWHIYVIMLLRSVGGAFHWPAMQASTSLMVPKEHLSRVAGFNQMLSGAIGIFAPPTGALLIEVLPMERVLAIDFFTAMIAILPLLVIAIPQPPSSEDENRKVSVLRDLAEGMRYTRRWPGMLILFFLAIMINFLFNPAFALMPLLVTDHFHGQAIHLGWLEAAWGIGIVVGGLTLGLWGGFKRTMLTPGMGLTGQGIGLVIMGLAPSNGFFIALGGLLFVGFMFPITNGPLQAVLQKNVDPDMQGRVFTLMGSVTSAITPLSLLVAGPIADLLGVRFWFAAAGVACVVIGIGGYFIPALMNLEADMQAAKARAVPVPVASMD